MVSEPTSQVAKTKTGERLDVLKSNWVRLLESWSHTSVCVCQENPQGGKREVEDDCVVGRSSKGDKTSEEVGVQNQDQRQTGLASQVEEGGPCGHPLTLQQTHTDLDSDVSEDSDQELDIEEYNEFTLNP